MIESVQIISILYISNVQEKKVKRCATADHKYPDPNAIKDSETTDDITPTTTTSTTVEPLKQEKITVTPVPAVKPNTQLQIRQIQAGTDQVSKQPKATKSMASSAFRRGLNAPVLFLKFQGAAVEVSFSPRYLISGISRGGPICENKSPRENL